MTGRKNRPLQVPLVVPYKALEKFPKALYGTTEGTCSARFSRPVTRSRLSTEEDLPFQIDWSSLIVESKFTVFALLYYVFEGKFRSTSAREPLFKGLI